MKNRYLPFSRLPGVAFVCVLMAIAACSRKDSPAATVSPDTIPSIPDKPFTATYKTTGLAVSTLFQLSDTFHLKTDSLPEISGLVRASDTGGDAYWGEEDSGNKNAVYLLDTLGRLLGTKYLPGVFNRDWEDIAAGPGPEKGSFYIYLADIGDNLHIFPFITVYRFPAPSTTVSSWKDSLIGTFHALNFIYPDGPHDAEALMVDPLSGDIYVITKESSAGVYVARYPQNTTEATRLTRLGTLPISTVTAADISPDGKGILIKNYDDIYYWTRKTGESVADCLQQTPSRLAYHQELQGEAIAWDPAGKSFFTVSEKVGSAVQVLYHYVSR